MHVDILVVDDEPDIRTTLAELLRDEGYVVEELETALTLVHAIERLQPRLVLLDLTIPGVSVRDVVMEIHSRGLSSDVSIVALSGLEDTVKLADHWGLSGAVKKPFEIRQLLREVARFCPPPSTTPASPPY